MTALNGDDNDNSTPSSALTESSSAAVADSDDTIGSNYDNTIGGSISLIHESKQQSTDDRGEERQRQFNDRWDGGGEKQQSALR